MIYIVGAGPGDLGLITLKGVECIKRADVIIYDRLVNEELLCFAKEGARKIYVGKSSRGLKGSAVQLEINRVLVKEGKRAENVVRLKGGDPFIFGRGAEEIEALVKAGLKFEVVPGVTSAIAGAAYAGISLTDRRISSSVAIVTGQEAPGKPRSSIEWKGLAKGAGTLVFLMGVGNLGKIVGNLLKHGASSAQRVAVIKDGTLPSQRTIEGQLKNIVEKVKEAKILPPALIVIGDVIRLRKSLRWFDLRPLFGKRIVVTRARPQASRFSRLLKEQGAEVVEFPTIKIEVPDSYESLERVLLKIERYDWVIFTSCNGVERFFEYAGSRVCGYFAQGRGVKLCAIGEITKQALERRGLKVALMPKDFSAEGLLEVFARKNMKGKRVLIARAQQARDMLIKGLKAQGAVVDLAFVYKTVVPDVTGRQGKRELDELFKKKIDLITFTSSSTVRNFAKIVGKRQLNSIKRSGMKFASIGPITAGTLREYGLPVDIMPKKWTIKALAEAIVESQESV